MLGLSQFRCRLLLLSTASLGFLLGLFLYSCLLVALLLYSQSHFAVGGAGVPGSATTAKPFGGFSGKAAVSTAKGFPKDPFQKDNVHVRLLEFADMAKKVKAGVAFKQAGLFHWLFVGSSFRCLPKPAELRGSAGQVDFPRRWQFFGQRLALQH